MSDEQKQRSLICDLYAGASLDQIPPSGNWLTWDIIGGRGSGKTWAVAQWAKSRAFAGDDTLIVSPSLKAEDLARRFFLNDPCTIYNKNTQTILVGEEQNRIKVISGRSRVDSLRGCRYGAIAVDDSDCISSMPILTDWLHNARAINPKCRMVFVNRPLVHLFKHYEQHVLTELRFSTRTS